MTTATPPVDDYAAAFAELNNPGTPPADPPAGDPPADPPVAADPPADPPAGDPPADPPVAADPPTDPPAGDPPADPPAPAETPEQMHARIRAEIEDELKRKAPDPAPALAPAPADPPKPKAVYSDEEKTKLAKYQEDWPDVAASEKLARRAEYHDLVSHIYDQFRPIIEGMQGKIDELQGRVSVHSKRTMYDDLVEMVPDYDDVRDKTLAWIDTQPEYLKAAYKHVADNGSADEVADLINRYKRETNYQGKPVAPVAPAAAAPAAPAIAPAAAAAAAALAPVQAGRSEPKGEPDKHDFDSAFAEFSAKT